MVRRASEPLGIAGDSDDRRIDLEKSPALSFLGVAGERPASEADDAEASAPAAGIDRSAHDLDRLRHRALRVVVGARGGIENGLAFVVPDALGSVQGSAVGQDVEVAVARGRDPVYAVVAALRIAPLDG
jgi:hypothetical protein